MSGFETLDIDKFILQLRNDAQLQALFPGGIVQLSMDIEQREPPPLYVTFNLTSEHDVNANGGNRVYASSSYTIQATGKEIGYDVLRPIMERIDNVITAPGASTVIGTTYISRFLRTNVLSRTDNLDSVRWHYLAGVYETIAFSVQ